MLDPPAPSMAPRAAPWLQFSPEDHRNNDAPQTFRSDEAPGQTSTVGVGQDPPPGVVVKLVSQVEQAGQSSCRSDRWDQVKPGPMWSQ